MSATVPAKLAAVRAEPHWLYRLYDGDGRLLYVGQTRRPVQRFRMWFSRGDGLDRYVWFAQVRRVDWRCYPNWHDVTVAEKRAIEAEAPVHNRLHKPKLVAA